MVMNIKRLFTRLTRRPRVSVDLSAITPIDWIRNPDPLGIRNIRYPIIVNLEGWYQSNRMVRDMLTHVIRTNQYKGVKLPPITWRGRP